MKLGKTPKNTEHTYKGFTIKGTHYLSSGGEVLGGRHFVEGGLKRNYNILKNGKLVINPHCIIETLKDAKLEVDEYIERKKNEQEKRDT